MEPRKKLENILTWNSKWYLSLSESDGLSLELYKFHLFQVDSLDSTVGSNFLSQGLSNWFTVLYSRARNAKGNCKLINQYINTLL